MKGRSLLALSALAIVLGCEDQRLPTGLTAPARASAIISDGSHGDNPDFFFLPPLVQLKKNNPDFELGKFNNALQPSLTIEICKLDFNGTNEENRGAEDKSSQKRDMEKGKSENGNSQNGNSENGNEKGLPAESTKCVAGAPVKTFAPGTVQLVNLPAPRNSFPKQLDPDEWWRGRNPPADGFYYVLWNTRESNLDFDKFYRIKVFIDGSDLPLGFADVDPRSKGHKWKYSRSGQIIQMVDDVKLPIPFRVERGALCGGAISCNSATVTNDNPNGDVQIVTVDGGAGAIAGASFPDGWLPAGGPQSVVVTINEVPSGEDPVTHTRTTPCHSGIPFQQFNRCFKFTTTPQLVADEETGDQFARDVTVAVCYVLYGTSDPRKNFAEMYASGPSEPAHALDDVSDVGILGGLSRDCTTVPPIGVGNANPLARLASTGWRSVKEGLARLFGVKTAYAIDLGLGGIVKGFSNIGPALTAHIEGFSSTEVTLGTGVTTTISRAKIVGSHVHGSEGAFDPSGINGVPVTFTVGSGSGTVKAVGSAGAGAAQVTVTTSTLTISSEEIFEDGIASVIWTPPTAPGTYTLTATGPATGGPVTFTATVPMVIGFNLLQGSLTARGHQTCGLTSGGAAYCWGSTISPSITPVAVAGGLTFSSLTVGPGHNCGLTSGGAAYCWGANNNGQLGDGTTTNRTMPVAVAGGITFASLTAGFFHTCGVTSGGAAYCWGSNIFGGLGDGTTTNRPTPVAVAGDRTFASLSGGVYYTCGLTSGGAAYCWGYNGDGNLGDGTETNRTTQAAVAGGLTFASLTTGAGHTCGLTSGGAAYCWGYNGDGNLGDGSTTGRTTPVAVAGGQTFASLAAGSRHTCGLTSGGAAYCWGFNLYGQLGNGTTISPSTTPVAVAGELTFASLTGGEEHTCGLTSDGGAAYCWGWNFAGQLGDGTTTSRTTPVVVANP